MRKVSNYVRYEHHVNNKKVFLGGNTSIFLTNTQKYFNLFS